MGFNRFSTIDEWNFSVTSCLFSVFIQDNERKEAGLRKLAAELKEREDLQDQIETLRGQIRTVSFMFLWYERKVEIN